MEEKRPWYRKKRYLLSLGAGFVGFLALANGSDIPNQRYQAQTYQIPSTQAYVPATKVTSAPTLKQIPSRCNSNYSGCLKQSAGDYDCAGGTGDGPNYTGAVRVIGYDEYGLDRDGDGLACEK